MPGRRGALAFVALMAGSCSDPAERRVTATVQQAVAGAWTQASAGPNPPARWGHSSDWDPVTGRVILFGGIGGTIYNDAWAWDGGSWTQICNGTSCASPPARLQAAMAYDFAQGRMVMYGGQGFSLMGDSWSLVGSTWMELCPSCAPGPRTNMGMAYDRGRGVMVLFGGSNGSNAWYGDTYELDAGSWVQRCASPGCGPSPREGPAMSWDGTRLILMGGNDGTSALNDMWTWNGSTGVWLPLPAPMRPPPREESAVAFDSSRNRVILYGGALDSGSAAQDTWEWDGTTWAETNDGVINPAPTARFGVPMAFNTVAADAVIMGGTTNGLSDDADTWIYVGPPGDGGTDAGGLPNGTPCLDAGVGASGFCTDGVCCPVACGGQCESCAGGACTGTSGPPDGGRPPCNGFGACQGTCVPSNPSGCTYPGSGTVCAPPSCAGTTHFGPGTCDGAGSCLNAGVNCAPYACQSSGCLVSCTTDTQCAPGNCCSVPQCTFACAADGGSPDAGTSDGGSADAGAPDAGSLDAGSFDGGTDAGSLDSGAPDAGLSDAGLADAGASDAGPADAGLSPSAADLGCGCGSSRGAGWLFLAVAVSAGSGRRRRKRTLAAL